jgi:hypothetical protein
MDGMWRAGVCAGVAITALLLGGCDVTASADGVGATAGAQSIGDGSPEDAAGGTGDTGGPGGSTGIDAGTDVDRADGGGGVGSGPDEPGPKFPVTLRRTGGIAGFDDSVVVQSDGRVVVDTRLVHGRTCTLDKTEHQQLIAALTALRAAPVDPAGSSGQGTATAPPADDAESEPITLAVTDDLSRAFDLSDSSLGGVSDLIGAVVTDVTLTAPANATCTAPTGVATAPPGVAAAG